MRSTHERYWRVGGNRAIRFRVELLVFCGSLVAASFLGTRLLESDKAGPAQVGDSAQPLIYVGAARYPEYASLRQIVTASTLVVRAEALRAARSYQVFPANVPLRKLPKKKAAAFGVIETDISFEVQKKIFGKANPKHLRVVQLGGQTGRQRLIVEGEPLSVPGLSYVLFLRKRSDGRYSIVGGPQGRYQVVNGKLTLVSRDYSTAPVPTVLRGLPVTTFERTFGALLRSRRIVPHTSALLTKQEKLRQHTVRGKPKTSAGKPPPRPPGK
jgi:hypothetical protein